MSDYKDGNDYLLFIKETTAATAWLTVACVTTNGVQLTAAERQQTTKCDPKNFERSKAGRRSGTLSASGKTIDESGEPTKASFKKLRSLWKNGTTFPVKFVGVNDPDDIIRGDAYITSLSKTAELDQDVTFDVSLKLTGEILDTPEVVTP